MKLLNLGFGSWVRAEEIMLIEPHGENNRYVMGRNDRIAIKSAVLLKNGDLVPGYYKARTLVEGWREVMSEIEIAPSVF